LRRRGLERRGIIREGEDDQQKEIKWTRSKGRRCANADEERRKEVH
jgi:hypothetical protein